MTINLKDAADFLETLAKLCRDADIKVDIDDKKYKDALISVSRGGIEWLQRALGVNDDGIVGPITQKSLDDINVDILIETLLSQKPKLEPISIPPTSPDSIYPKVFIDAFDATMKWEGGYSNDPRDPGGETNFGIDKRSHPDEDIKNMTRARAREIAWESYWIPSKADLMPPEVGPKVFDLAFNTGLTGSGKILQRALNSLGTSLDDDGKVGQETLEAVSKVNPRSLHLAIKLEADKYYRSLKNFPIFGEGWLNRNNAI